MSDAEALQRSEARYLACWPKPTCNAGLHVTGPHPGQLAHLLTRCCSRGAADLCRKPKLHHLCPRHTAAIVTQLTPLRGRRHRIVPLHAVSCTMFSACRPRTCTLSGRGRGMPASACKSAWCLAVQMPGARRSAPTRRRRSAGKQGCWQAMLAVHKGHLFGRAGSLPGPCHSWRQAQAEGQLPVLAASLGQSSDPDLHLD